MDTIRNFDGSSLSCPIIFTFSAFRSVRFHVLRRPSNHQRPAHKLMFVRFPSWWVTLLVLRSGIIANGKMGRAKKNFFFKLQIKYQTHINAQTERHTDTRTHARTHCHSLTHTHMHTHTHTRARACTHARTHTHPRTHSRTLTHARTHTHTHTHTPLLH